MTIGNQRSIRSIVLAPAIGLASVAIACSAVAAGDVGTAGGPRHLEAGQPVAMVHATVEAAQRALARGQSRPKSGGSSNLSFHGGSVQTAPLIYVVYWGSQWNNNDPSGEASILDSFYMNLANSSWSATDTQYCEGVKSGTVTCPSSATFAGNSPMMPLATTYTWYDNGTAAPTHPKQSQIAAEAVKAASHCVQSGACTSGGLQNVQFVIATATGNNSSGFGTQYCAWHSSTSSTYGNLSYTNLPYITDAGANCGANFNGLGQDAGITIVAGHEMAESVTDPFPSTGWVDGSGSEIGDKCAWNSATKDVGFSNGYSFPVQPLWSNADNGGAGGCVLSY